MYQSKFSGSEFNKFNSHCVTSHSDYVYKSLCLHMTAYNYVIILIYSKFYAVYI